MRRHSICLQLIGIACCIALINAFSTRSGIRHETSPFPRHLLIMQSTNSDSGERPELVAQSTFAAAIETLYREMAKQQGVEYVPQDDKNVQYAIGRTMVDLSIPPQIDLVETPELVLVNGVSEAAQVQGIQLLDTIVSISAANDTFTSKTMGLNIEETVANIHAAIEKARNSGEDTIKLEVNRLIKGYY